MKQAGMCMKTVEVAVVNVYEAMQEGGEQPGAEHWTLHDHPRAVEMVGRVCEEYRRLAGVPYCGRDYVITETYIEYRKRTKAQKKKWREELSVPTELVEVA